ncbi:hypothetical protein IV203_009701 [Nitzschia inconspicua]|uniref:Uncharacterized protein n=1 Tax=Nitzschia inconspicua TaxID=303405 RepID=A0A9K3KW37_9STRA|nr:hypothetical protein IV203_009701 [Nitzschia inconspicua]
MDNNNNNNNKNHNEAPLPSDAEITTSSASLLLSLHKSASEGNLSRITATTAAGTNSLSIGKTQQQQEEEEVEEYGIDHNNNNNNNDIDRLTIFQLDSWSDDNEVHCKRKNRSGALSQKSSFLSGHEDATLSITTTPSSSSSSPLSEQKLSLSRPIHSLPEGIPSEVIIIRDHTETSLRGSILWSDDLLQDGNDRLQQQQQEHLYRTLLNMCREKLRATSHENDTLHEFLRQTKGYVEDLLVQRDELIQAIDQLEEDVSQRSDQELLLKVIMLCSLFMYLTGGSPKFLVAAVGLHLFVTFVNLLFTTT